MKEKLRIDYVDCTPTWSAIMPSLLYLVESGTDSQKKVARDEIFRLAKAFDDSRENIKNIRKLAEAWSK
jgi:hypothetical protein